MALTEVVTLRISPRLYSTLEKQAEDKGVSMAEHIREVLDRRSGQDDVMFTLIQEITELVYVMSAFNGYFNKETHYKFKHNKKYAHEIVRKIIKHVQSGK